MKETIDQKSRQETLREIAESLEELLTNDDGELVRGKNIVENLKVGQITEKDMSELLDVCVECQNESQRAEHELKVDGMATGTEMKVENLKHESSRLSEIHSQLEKLIEKEE